MHAPLGDAVPPRIFCLQERARGKAEGTEDGPSNAAEEDMEGDSDGAGEEGTGRPEEDGLESEVLRGKNMDVASMDALKKRIEVRIFCRSCLISLHVNVLSCCLISLQYETF